MTTDVTFQTADNEKYQAETRISICFPLHFDAIDFVNSFLFELILNGAERSSLSCTHDRCMVREGISKRADDFD